jgi:hypothetical protein
MQEPGERLREIGAALREPITRLGLLTDFAADRVRLALGRGEPALKGEVHPRLRAHFDYLVEHTRDLRVAVERVIRRFGSRVVDRQFVVARIADMATELYVRAAVLSRVQAVMEAHEAGEAETPSLAGPPTPLDGDAVERLLRLTDLAVQRSGLRFRDAREALSDARDDLVREVAADVLRTEDAAAGPAPAVEAEAVAEAR